MAAKIKDGLFIGDAESAGDAEFLDLNKIVNLGNLAAREVPNRFSAHGLVYLSLNWQDHNDFVLFDQSLSAVVDIVTFVDESLRHGQSLLLFSTRGVGRCAVAACVYLMYKYRWGFEKSYDYIVSKKPDIDINRGFVHQLFLLDKKLSQLRKSLPIGATSLSGNQLVPGVPPGPSALSRNPNSPLPLFAPMSGSPDVEKARRDEWDPFYLQQKGNNSMEGQSLRVQEEVGDELLLIYSYLNSKNTISSVPGPYPDALRQSKSFAIRFNPDLYVNHQYEEPGGNFVIATKTSSGRPHPALPPSPSDVRHGNSHGPDHKCGILKGGKHYNIYRRKQNKTASGYAPSEEPHRSIGFESTRSIGFDSPPRGSAPISSGGWASPEQRLHDILDDLSNHNVEPVPAPHDNARASRPKPRSSGKGGSSSRQRNRSGELTDTSDEEADDVPYLNGSNALSKVKEPPPVGFADSKISSGSAGAERQRDIKPVRAESKTMNQKAPVGFKDSGGGSQAIYRPAVDSKVANPPVPSLYDLANMQVAPAYQSASRQMTLGSGDVDDDTLVGSLAGNLYGSERKSGAQSTTRPVAKPVAGPIAEAKQTYSGYPAKPVRESDRDTSRAYRDRVDTLDIESDVGQHSMLTGGGTIIIDAEDDDDEMYASTASSGVPRKDEQKQSDAVIQSLLRAKQLAEDAMGRTSTSYQAQQDRQSQAVQQQDRARQRQGGGTTAPLYGSHRQEAWSGSSVRDGGDSSGLNSTGTSRNNRDDSRSRESVAAAAVAAAEAMANYRTAPGGRPGSGRAGGASMPRFDSGATIGINKSGSSDSRRPTQNDRSEPKKPEWVGTSGSLDSVGSGRDSVGSTRTPKVYRHGSPAPRTATSSSRLSQTGGGSTSSLRRDSLGRDSLGSTGGDSLGTQRSRESNSSSYRRPSPSPYEQSNRPSQSSRPTSATAPRGGRDSTPTRPERPTSANSGMGGGGVSSRSSTPTRKTGWRF